MLKFKIKIYSNKYYIFELFYNETLHTHWFLSFGGVSIITYIELVFG